MRPVDASAIAGDDSAVGRDTPRAFELPVAGVDAGCREHIRDRAHAVLGVPDECPVLFDEVADELKINALADHDRAIGAHASGPTMGVAGQSSEIIGATARAPAK